MKAKYAVIVAGGSGSRAGGDVPKQFRMLCGLPVLWWSVKAFYKQDPEVKIRIVMHPGFFDLWDVIYSEMPDEEKVIDFEIICGGRSRLESVCNGIMEIPEDSYIAVHDAARPLVSIEMIERGWKEAELSKAAIPVVPMIDSIRELEGTKSVALDRSRYVRVQTPQIFDGRLLKEAYNRELTARMTDDASVVEAAGIKVSLYEGDEWNMKITNPDDFIIAEILLKKRLI